MHELGALPGECIAPRAYLHDARLVVGLAEVLLEVHAGGEGLARPRQHQHPAAVVQLQRVEHLVHLPVHGRVHGVALVGPVHGDPGDAVLELDEDGIAPGLAPLRLAAARRLLGRFPRPS